MARILIVEDSRFMGRQLRERLEVAGHQVVACTRDGSEGIVAFRSECPELVLLDITMPNMDGRECLQKILAEDPAARVLMLSAIDDRGIVEECLAIGAKGYLTKPPRLDDPAFVCQVAELAV